MADLEFLESYFKERDWKWRLKGGRYINPTQNDFQDAIDEARRLLYNEPEGSSLQVGRLVFIKEKDGLDIYVFVGQTKEKGKND